MSYSEPPKPPKKRPGNIFIWIVGAILFLIGCYVAGGFLLQINQAAREDEAESSLRLPSSQQVVLELESQDVPIG